MRTEICIKIPSALRAAVIKKPVTTAWGLVKFASFLVSPDLLIRAYFSVLKMEFIKFLPAGSIGQPAYL